jgi:lipid-binding SYLF domain-containing protein
MKTITFALVSLTCALSASAIEKTELDNRIRTLQAKFEALQHQPDKAIPAETLAKAQGVVLMDRTKAGFIFAYQGGGGVALVRDKDGKWSPPALVSANEGSLGFQIGAEQAFYVILLMDTNATRMLTDSKFEVGGEARGTAGEASTGTGISSDQKPVLVYDDRKGLYGGAALKAGALAPDDKANQLYYGKPVTVKEILFEKKVEPTESATALAKTLTEYSKPKR